MKEKILKLRGEGLSYKQIVRELGCSIGTVAYHCGENQKIKAQQRKNRLKDPNYQKPDKKPKTSRFCKMCGNLLFTHQPKFCSCKCNSEYKHRIYIEEWKAGRNDGSKSGGANVSYHIRGYLFEKYGNKCSRCGWNTPNPFTGKVILEIEHIDGNSTNNKEENLDLICPNCHSLTSTYKALNKGNANKDRLKYYGLIP